MSRVHSFLRGERDMPMLVAHRGLSSRAPENTLAALRLAVATGVPMVEVDVHLSADDRAVVIHDRTLQRTTTGNGAVRSHTVEELRRFDAGSWFHPSFSDERIPTLDEVLECTDAGVHLNVELKSHPFHSIPVDQVAACVLESVRSRDALDRVIFTSFDLSILSAIRRREPDASLGLLHDWFRALFRPSIEAAVSIQASAFICERRELTRSTMSDARRHGLAVFVYTVNDPLEAERLRLEGVDGLISDAPDLLQKMMSPLR